MRILGKIAYAAVMLVMACGGALQAPTKTLDPLAGNYVLKGGGGALDNMKALANAYNAIHPNVVFQGYEDVGSDAAVTLANSADIDLGFISRDLKAAEKGTVEVLPIGFSGTGVGVNASNPVKNLTKEQVRRIYAGEITDWKDIGGNPGKIRVLLREPGAATRSAFESYFFGSTKPVYAKDAIEVFEADETLKAVGSFKDSIGMMSMVSKSFNNTDIKMVAIDGVAATKENLSNATYPIRRPLYVVYNPDPNKVRPAIKDFISWIKGPDGQKVIASL
jgi:phosphate transport system substrate-binding protein